MVQDTPQKYPWMILHTNHFNDNVRTFHEKLLPNTKIAMVVKSNAYGHGLIEIGLMCQTNTLIHTLCTINEREALQLRQAGVTKPILIIGYTHDYKAAILADCQITVFDESSLRQIALLSSKLNLQAKIHIKIDTGLSRLGFLPESIHNVMIFLSSQPRIQICGVMSHFSKPSDKEYSSYQLDRFHKALALGNFSSKITRHICNTGGAFLYPEAHLDMVRIGLGLYGYFPSVLHHELKPVAQVCAPLLQIKTVPSDTFIGYELETKTTQETKIGIISFGYHEGLDRNSAQHNYVCMNGYKAPFIGRVSMNLATIDLTNIPEHALQNHVTTLGCPLAQEKFKQAHQYPSIYEQLVRLDPEIKKTIC